MRAQAFNGYEELKLVDLPKPAVSDGRLLVRITAAGVTPLGYTHSLQQISRVQAAVSPGQ